MRETSGQGGGAASPGLHVGALEVFVAQGARLRLVNIQNWDENTWHFSRERAIVGRDASLTSASVAFGGDYARVRTDSTLSGRGGNTRLLAVYFGEGRQMHDFRTLQAHEAPKTLSDLLASAAFSKSIIMIARPSLVSPIPRSRPGSSSSTT